MVACSTGHYESPGAQIRRSCQRFRHWKKGRTVDKRVRHLLDSGGPFTLNKTFFLDKMRDIRSNPLSLLACACDNILGHNASYFVPSSHNNLLFQNMTKPPGAGP